MQKLIMLVAIPGAGKSTYIQTNMPGVAVVSPDEIRKEVLGDINDQSNGSRIWGIAAKRVANILSKGFDVVLDATNVNSRNRQNFIDSIRELCDCDFTTKAIVFDVDPEIAKARVNKDIKMKRDRAMVPDHVIDRMYQQFLSGKSNLKTQFDEVVYART